MSPSRNKRPRWWPAWYYFLRRFNKPDPKDEFEPPSEERIGEWIQRGCPWGQLEDWLPAEDDRTILKQVHSIVQNLYSMNSPAREAEIKRALGLLDRPDYPWPALKKMASTYIGAIPYERAQPAVTDISRFAADRTQITIYMDESWPGSLKNASSADRETGVIGCLVCCGFGTDNLLPWVPTHLRQTNNRYLLRGALNDALRHSLAVPFCFEVRKAGIAAAGEHHLLRDLFLQYLLGWVLQGVGSDLPAGSKVDVRIFVERHDDGQPRDGTHAARRLLSIAAESSRRFDRWTIDKWVWAEKQEALVPYGDLLAYMPLVAARRLIGEWAQYRNLPGYMQFDLDLVPLLKRIDSLAQTQDVNALLDAIPHLHDSWVGRKVLDEAGAVIRSNPVLQSKLLKALDKRFRDPQRNLDLLTLQLEMIRGHILPELPESSSLAAKLLWTAVELHQANHSGDPSRAKAAVAKYEAARNHAFRHYRLLVANIDCKLAIHYADRFEFQRALEVLERLISDRSYPDLQPWTQGVIESSMGQILAMLGRHQDAEQHFLQADQQFKEAELDDAEREHERLRTATYRAINALDEGRANAMALVEEVTGPLAEAAAKYAEAGEGKGEFTHRLLLRALVSLGLAATQPAAQARSAYLARGDHWQPGTRHPWEMIALYRGILSDDSGTNSYDWYRKAGSIHGSGATMQLVRAMIQTTASQVHREFREQALQSIAALRIEFRGVEKAEEALDKLAGFLGSTKPVPPAEVLRVLPFNYH